jgi:hypothetical protein
MFEDKPIAVSSGDLDAMAGKPAGEAAFIPAFGGQLARLFRRPVVTTANGVGDRMPVMPTSPTPFTPSALT